MCVPSHAEEEQLMLNSRQWETEEEEEIEERQSKTQFGMLCMSEATCDGVERQAW